ncbi:restriction endonuclease subunit S [Gemella haemolysans]|uniref:restriction endonuclease subunit S n=1 Tax=Gemella haemolysans TaxID=1379 RepID=UPI0029133431|nr:restriction endonuclease subunit S [Gemella haemolysans]MDU3831253.1 restriction endonuclease subunit S [Gemella haemolysans]
MKYIDNSEFSKLNRSKLIKNDILFTYVGTIGEVGLIEENNKYYLAPNVALIRVDNKKIHPKYMIRLLQSNDFRSKEIDKRLKSSSMKNLTMENIREFNIAVPPLHVQQHVVSILDKFDTLVNDIKEGLPKEIEQRQQQYEYWRECLLNFPR